jgi:hypothetical protein
MPYLVFALGFQQHGELHLAYRKRSYKNSRYRNRKSSDYQKVAMLNLRAITPFKYHLREILDASKLDEDFINAFIANLITKGSRGSLSEAKDYVRDLEKQGVFTNTTSENICSLLDRHRKYR